MRSEIEFINFIAAAFVQTDNVIVRSLAIQSHSQVSCTAIAGAMTIDRERLVGDRYLHVIKGIYEYSPILIGVSEERLLATNKFSHVIVVDGDAVTFVDPIVLEDYHGATDEEGYPVNNYYDDHWAIDDNDKTGRDCPRTGGVAVSLGVKDIDVNAITDK